MAAPDSHYNATLWATQGPLVMACFRVRTDAAGRMTAASVADLNQPDMQVGFDAALRKRLQERYGAATEIVVVVDGGADFERFRRERIAGRSAGPRRQVEQRRMELGDAPSQ